MSATYRVMLDGKSADRDRDEVATHLVRILNLSEESARALLDSRGVVVKDGLDRDAAMRVRGVLERAGCVVVVNREVPAPGAARADTRRGSHASHGESRPPSVTLAPAGGETPPAPLFALGRLGAAKAYLAIGAALALATFIAFAIAK